MVQLTVVLVSGTPVITDVQVEVSTTIREVKKMILNSCDVPILRQQLVLNGGLLQDAATLGEMSFSEELELQLVKMQSIDVCWEPDLSQVMHEHGLGNLIRSPQFRIDNGEVGTGTDCVSMILFPTGQEKHPMLKPGFSSLLVNGPSNSLLLVQVVAGTTVRERLFRCQPGSCGWTNFAEAGSFQEVLLRVMHHGVLPAPALQGIAAASWNLCDALGGLPLAGHQFRETVSIGQVVLLLVFFPDGHARAPTNHTSLWVQPIEGLADRRYTCTVDGVAQKGDGESILNFPRPEIFGNIEVALDPVRDSGCPLVDTNERAQTASTKLTSPSTTSSVGARGNLLRQIQQGGR